MHKLAISHHSSVKTTKNKNTYEILQIKFRNVIPLKGNTKYKMQITQQLARSFFDIFTLSKGN